MQNIVAYCNPENLSHMPVPRYSFEATLNLLAIAKLYLKCRCKKLLMDKKQGGSPTFGQTVPLKQAKDARGEHATY